MKVKKRIMIALAGAMILGVFGTSGVPVMADASEPDFTISIPADLTITQLGWNKAGTISLTVNKYGRFLLSTDNKDAYRYLKNANDETIPYQICLIEPGYQSEIALTSDGWEGFLNPLYDYEIPIGARIDNYSDMSPGEYTDTVSFKAQFWEPAT